MNRGIHVLYASNCSIENGEDRKGFGTRRYRPHNSFEQTLVEKNSMSFDDESSIWYKADFEGNIQFWEQWVTACFYETLQDLTLYFDLMNFIRYQCKCDLSFLHTCCMFMNSDKHYNYTGNVYNNDHCELT